MNNWMQKRYSLKSPSALTTGVSKTDLAAKNMIALSFLLSGNKPII